MTTHTHFQKAVEDAIRSYKQLTNPSTFHLADAMANMLGDQRSIDWKTRFSIPRFDLKLPDLTDAFRQLVTPTSAFRVDFFDQRSAFVRFPAHFDSIVEGYARFSRVLQALSILPTARAAENIARTATLAEIWSRHGRDCRPLAASAMRAESLAVAQDPEILAYPESLDLDAVEAVPETEVAVLPTINLFEVHRAELVLYASKIPDLLEQTDLLDKLPCVQYFTQAQRVCRLVTLINTQRAAHGEEQIFKPTNRLMESLIALPNLIATNRTTFAEFVDYLYFIVYEAAGKDSLRYLGPLSDADAEPVWMTKNLRNLDLRHDVEHGSESDVRKKQKRVGAVYSSLIGQEVARFRVDFCKAQLELVRLVADMLYKLSEHLAVSTRTPADDHRGKQ